MLLFLGGMEPSQVPSSPVTGAFGPHAPPTPPADPGSTKLRVAAFSLVAGPLCLGIGDILTNLVVSAAGDSPTGIAAAVGKQPGIWSAAAVLLVLGAVLFLPGLIGLLLTAHGRGTRLTVIGASLLATGLVASVGHVVHYFGGYGTYAAAALPAPTIRSLERADSAVVTTDLVIVVFIVGFMLGTVLLMIGLRRARRIPVWAAVAGAVDLVATNSTIPAIGVLELLAGLAAFLPAALSLVRRPGSPEAKDAAEHVAARV